MENEKYQPSPEEQMTDEQRVEQRFEVLRKKMESGEMSDEEIDGLEANDFLQSSSFVKGANGERGGKLIREELDDNGDTIKLYRLPDGTLGRDTEFIERD